MMKENWVYCRGDIYCAKLDPGTIGANDTENSLFGNGKAEMLQGLQTAEID